LGTNESHRDGRSTPKYLFGVVLATTYVFREWPSHPKHFFFWVARPPPDHTRVAEPTPNNSWGWFDDHSIFFLVQGFFYFFYFFLKKKFLVFI